MSKSYAGACLCGEVRFEVHGTFDHFYLCHCNCCQKGSGSAHASNLFSSSATLSWLSGEGSITKFTLPGTRHTRWFCSQCGAAVPSLQMGGALLVVPAGSLEDPVDMKPDAHINSAISAAWDSDLADIPRFEGLP